MSFHSYEEECLALFEQWQFDNEQDSPIPLETIIVDKNGRKWKILKHFQPNELANFGRYCYFLYCAKLCDERGDFIYPPLSKYISLAEIKDYKIYEEPPESEKQREWRCEKEFDKWLKRRYDMRYVGI